MCRVVAYLGEPISLAGVLFETDSSLVRQTYSPRMMAKFLNLAGFGMVAWDPQSVRPEEPFTYRVATLPAFDRNLRSLSGKLAPTCLIAHVRGVTYSEHEMVAETSLHPFRFRGARVALAHNGPLREFASMRYDLIPHVRPELAQIEGTTDSEWIYALVLSQLDDPFGLPETRELADATASALRLLREIRGRHGIDTSSPVNLFLTSARNAIGSRSISSSGRKARTVPAARKGFATGSQVSREAGCLRRPACRRQPGSRPAAGRRGRRAGPSARRSRCRPAWRRRRRRRAPRLAACRSRRAR
jgi:glutamine amidotransferase